MAITVESSMAAGLVWGGRARELGVQYQCGQPSANTVLGVPDVFLFFVMMIWRNRVMFFGMQVI